MEIGIGMELYQYASPRILHYIVEAINELKTNEHVETFFIAKCKSCSDHEECIVAFRKDEIGNLVYSHMINGYEEDGEYYKENGHYRNGQYYWHKEQNQRFFLTKKEAQAFVIQKNIDYYSEQIKEKQDSIKSLEVQIEDEKTKLEILKEK